MTISKYNSSCEILSTEIAYVLTHNGEIITKSDLIYNSTKHIKPTVRELEQILKYEEYNSEVKSPRGKRTVKISVIVELVMNGNIRYLVKVFDAMGRARFFIKQLDRNDYQLIKKDSNLTLANEIKNVFFTNSIKKFGESIPIQLIDDKKDLIYYNSDKSLDKVVILTNDKSLNNRKKFSTSINGKNIKWDISYENWAEFKDKCLSNSVTENRSEFLVKISPYSRHIEQYLDLSEYQIDRRREWFIKDIIE